MTARRILAPAALLVALCACDVYGSCPGALAAPCSLQEDAAPCAEGFACMPAPGGGVDEGMCVPSGGIETVSAGTTHGCAVTSLGYVLCWGANDFGQIGDGREEDAPTPRTVVADRAFVSVSSGDGHTCALDEKGGVSCWGRSDGRQTGDRGEAPDVRPALVPALREVQQVSAGRAHTCVLDAGGNVQCFGTNEDGQIGRDTGGQPGGDPQTVALGGSVAQVASGGSHTCARLDDGTVRCWGSNVIGQLARPLEDPPSSAAAVEIDLDVDQDLDPPEDSVATQISSGGRYTCALRADGRVVCWGANDFGQLGRDTGAEEHAGVGYVLDEGGAPLGDVRAIASGREHACAVVSDARTVVCWGKGAEGQLGNGETAELSKVPVEVARLEGVAAITAGYAKHSCALLEKTREVFCWGSNEEHQLGDGTPLNAFTPTKVKRLP